MILKTKKFFRKKKSVQNKWSRIPKKRFKKNLAIKSIDNELMTNRETMTYAEAQKYVDVEDVDGEIQRLNIEEPMEITINASYQNEKQTFKPKDMFCDLKACVKILDEESIFNSSRSNFKLPKSFIRAPCVLKSESDHIDYDADAQDLAWLKLINSHQRLLKLSTISLDNLEEVFEMFEKESFQLSLIEAQKPKLPPVIIEPIIGKIQPSGNSKLNTQIKSYKCEICKEITTLKNVLKCKNCEIVVHVECYKFIDSRIPAAWTCDLCLYPRNSIPTCSICPTPINAFLDASPKITPLMVKQVESQWAHARCVAFSKAASLDSEMVGRTNPRIKMCCSTCLRSATGYYLHCQSIGCRVAFHIMCAHACSALLQLPTQTNQSEQGYGGSQNRPTILCYKHSKLFRKRLFKMKKADLKLPGAAAPVEIIVPSMEITKIASEKLSTIGECLHARDKSYAIDRLHSYWFLKRKCRRGFPLITHYQQMLQLIGRPVSDESSSSDSQIDNASFKLLKKLRQQWEKARLLMELIRKREKLKREQLKYIEKEIMMRLTPEVHFFNRIIDQLQSKDNLKIFAHPVPVHLVPGYLDVIKCPMDYGTIRNKINRHEYETFEHFETDYRLILENCLKFNAKDSTLHAYVVKHQTNCEPIITSSKELFEDCISTRNRIMCKQSAAINSTNIDYTNNSSTINEFEKPTPLDFAAETVCKNENTSVINANNSLEQSTILLSLSEVEAGLDDAAIRLEEDAGLDDIEDESKILNQRLHQLLAALDAAKQNNQRVKGLRKKIALIRRQITNLSKFNDSASEKTLLYRVDNRTEMTYDDKKLTLSRLPIAGYYDNFVNSDSTASNFPDLKSRINMDDVEPVLTPISEVFGKDIFLETVDFVEPKKKKVPTATLR